MRLKFRAGELFKASISIRPPHCCGKGVLLVRRSPGSGSWEGFFVGDICDPHDSPAPPVVLRLGRDHSVASSSATKIKGIFTIPFLLNVSLFFGQQNTGRRRRFGEAISFMIIL
jgi:hypothetical protein